MCLLGEEQCFSGSKAIVSPGQSYRFLLEKHCSLKRLKNKSVPNVVFWVFVKTVIGLREWLSTMRCSSCLS